jgi:hypothetical protein
MLTPVIGLLLCTPKYLAVGEVVQASHLILRKSKARAEDAMLLPRLRDMGLMEFDRAKAIAEGRIRVEQALPMLRRCS